MPVQFGVLGPLEASIDGAPVPLAGAKQRAALAILVLNANRVVSVEALRAGIWGEDAPETTTAALQVYLSQLRKLIEPVRGSHSVILSRSPGYLLAVEPDQVDLLRFEAMTAKARKLMTEDRPVEARRLLHDAGALWRGPALADLALEPFAGAEVDRLEALRLAALEDRVDCDLAAGHAHGLVPELEALVAANPLRERLWAHLMVALYRSGRQADALRAYGRARRTLVDEYGIDPGPALRELERAILAQDPALGAPTDLPAVVAPRIRVPAAANPLVGRGAELAELTGRLRDPAVRLLTLVGPGGTGKTRLALEVATSAVDDFPGGVSFVRLAAVTDGALVVAAVAAVLEVREVPDQPLLDTVRTALGERPVLLVLDNFEQVLDAAPVVASLLEAVPQLRVVVTSRTALRVSGEHEYAVPPLSLPDLERLPRPEALGRIEAVELFVARARSVRPGFALDDGNAEAVARICVRIDGLPLAIELAAARLKVLSPGAILQRLGHCLDLLTGGGRDLPDRQRTLRATIDWSFGLLAESEQQLLARLGVFVGSFSLDAAEAVCVGGPADPDVIDGLATLVDNSLVRPAGGVVDLRFRLLETVREYAVERLHESSNEVRTDDLRRRHAGHFVHLAEAARPDLDGPDAPVLLEQLEADAANLRAAFEWAVGRELASAARLGVALRLFWLARGRLTEGREWLASIDGSRLPPDLAAALAVTSGTLAYYQTDWDVAVSQLEAGLAGSRAVGDPGGAASALCLLAGIAVMRGNAASGAALAEEALGIARGAGLYEPHVLALSASAIAAAVSGEPEHEKSLYEERLALVRARGDRRRTSGTLNTLAEIALDEGDLARARLWGEEALALARSMGALETRDALVTLARSALAERDVERAGELAREAIELSVALGQSFGLAASVRALAAVCAQRGQPERSVELFAAAERVSPVPAVEDVPLERDIMGYLDGARAALDERAFQAAWDVGAAMDEERLLAFALDDA